MVKAVEQVAYHTGNFTDWDVANEPRQAIEQLIRHRCAALVVHAKNDSGCGLASCEANPRHGAD